MCFALISEISGTYIRHGKNIPRGKKNNLCGSCDCPDSDSKRWLTPS
jgi:hypothetical protein